MLFHVLGVDYPVVYVSLDERQRSQEVVHAPLEGLRCIPQPQWHEEELEESEGCRDSSLRDVALWGEKVKNGH